MEMKKTTRSGKIFFIVLLLAAIIVPFKIWANAIHKEAEALRKDPAFRIVDNCETRIKNQIFRDYISTEDHQLIPCE